MNDDEVTQSPRIPLDVAKIAGTALSALSGPNLVDETIARNTQILLLCEVVEVLREIRDRPPLIMADAPMPATAQ